MKEKNKIKQRNAQYINIICKNNIQNAQEKNKWNINEIKLNMSWNKNCKIIK